MPKHDKTANSQAGQATEIPFNPQRRYLARQPEPGISRWTAARDQERAISDWEQRESSFGSNVTEILAHVVGFPRPPNSTEAPKLNALISTPTEGSRGFEYIQFRAIASPTDAIPDSQLLKPGSYEETIAVGLLPWAWYESVGEAGSYGPGDLIRIAYGDPINRMDPYVVQNTGGGEGSLAGLTYTDADIKASFYNGDIPKEDIFGKASPVRDLSKITEFVIHETVGSSAVGTIGTLLKRRVSVHYILSEDAKIYKTGGWDKILWHAGPGHNSRALGVEVVSPYYGAVYTGPHAVDLAKYWPIPPIKSPWAHYIRGTEQTYLLPNAAQFESTWQLTRQVTSSPLVNIPLKFLGLDKANNRFVITGMQNYHKATGPGIYAHSYFAHADGAVLVLYCYLRSKFGVDPGPGFGAREAFILVRMLMKATNLYKTPTNYWANLNLIPNFNELVATSFVPEQMATELT